MLQAVVLLLYVIRLLVELAVSGSIVPAVPDFSTIGLFVWPVLVASIVFDVSGALLTVAWIALLTAPRELEYVRLDSPVGLWGEWTQVLILFAVALAVSRRVAAERRARLDADRSRQAHLAAEMRYRRLFEMNSAPIVILNPDGVLVELNAAAQQTLGIAATGRDGRGLDVVSAFGARSGASLLSLLRDLQDAPSEEAKLDLSIGTRQYTVRAAVIDEPGAPAAFQVVMTELTDEARATHSMGEFALGVVEAQEEERRYLAQEIHDGPIQTLVHLCRQIDFVRGTDGDRKWVELRQTAEDIVNDLRAIARGLRPSILDDLGLEAAIGRLLDDIANRGEVATSIGVSGERRRLPSPIELALFRVAQEAISNADKHADASRIAVGLSFERRGVRLLVSDDGTGMPDENGADEFASGSLGLIGIRQRMHSIGGRVRVHSRSGEGVTIDAWAPTA